DFSVEHFLELRVAPRNRVPDDDEVELISDVLRLVALQRRDLLIDEKVAHRGVHVLVRSADAVPAALDQRGQRRHCGAAHANRVDPLHVLARGFAPAHPTTGSLTGAPGPAPLAWQPRLPRALCN